MRARKQRKTLIKKPPKVPKRAAQKSKQPQPILANGEEEKFVCDKCGEIFTSGWALGGHASRVHPGESESYRKKIQRR